MAEVVAFEQRRERPPALTHVELRLRLDDHQGCTIEMTVIDETGSIAAILPFGLQSKPRDFDLSLLADAWLRWHNESEYVA